MLANAGLVYREAGDLRTAKHDLRQSLAADPLQPVTLVNLGNVLFDMRDAGGAETMYRCALALNPREPPAYLGLGKVAFARRDAANAARMFEKTVELDASLVPAYLNLARACYMQSDRAAARRSLERALEFAPRSAEAREMLRTLKQVGVRSGIVCHVTPQTTSSPRKRGPAQPSSPRRRGSIHRHPRESGDPCSGCVTWIPACAGMTPGLSPLPRG